MHHLSSAIDGRAGLRIRSWFPIDRIGASLLFTICVGCVYAPPDETESPGKATAGASTDSSGTGGTAAGSGGTAIGGSWSGEDIGASAGAGIDTTITGVVTLPADATGRCFMVGLDDDPNGNNGGVDRARGEISGGSFNFSLTTGQVGEFYLWAHVDVDQGQSSSGNCGASNVLPPNAGDYAAFYGSGSLSAPSAPNVNIPLELEGGLAFTLTLIE